MNQIKEQSNCIKLVGIVRSSMFFSHEVFGENFFEFYVEVARLSEAVDILPVIISERLLNDIPIEEGSYVAIEGQFRSYNKFECCNNRLLLRVFARDIELLDDDQMEEFKSCPNEVFLSGYLCKEANYRVTPFGREITDMLIAVNRAYNKSDYIPCIAWGRNARYCDRLEVGDHVKVWGRIQSRVYQKRVGEEDRELKTAYEVSITRLEHIKEENNRNKNATNNS